MYKPDIITHNSVINAAAKAFGNPETKLKAFKTAMNVFKKIKLSPDMEPTSRTYSMLIKAVHKLVGTVEQRDLMVRKLLEFCLGDGLLNRHILEQLELTCSSKQKFMEMFVAKGYVYDYPINLDTVNPEWKRNADRL